MTRHLATLRAAGSGTTLPEGDYIFAGAVQSPGRGRLVVDPTGHEAAGAADPGPGGRGPSGLAAAPGGFASPGGASVEDARLRPSRAHDPFES